MGTGPGPGLGAAHQAGPMRVSLDVAEHNAEVLVLPDWERLVAPLPDVAAGAVMPRVPPRVGAQQPVHPPTQAAVAPRPEGEVEVVGQRATGEDPHRVAERRLGHPGE